MAKKTSQKKRAIKDERPFLNLPRMKKRLPGVVGPKGQKQSVWELSGRDGSESRGEAFVFWNTGDTGAPLEQDWSATAYF